ncbi:MAG: hypothetical protein LAT77_06560 [Aliidiomarina sp.]|uniref:hypothetical protein n=1 Tax=Aliidiomarina sp. TaxID=1872439 RepID=UPI0025C3D7F4|nr:hypothetical protein [Aliidiomarina sp.]MCH8501557.1 hypothetical protein [Aliidiomarina sp.]
MDFRAKTINAEFWFTQANQMLAAAEVLFCTMSSRYSEMETSVGCHKGSMFLLGIALENAFKGVVASQGKLIVGGARIDTKKSFPGCKNHNLSDLAKLISLETNQTEKELLQRLSIYTIWAGKYGTPLSEAEYTDAQGRQHQSTRDFEIAKNLIFELRARSDFDAQSGWPELPS